MSVWDIISRYHSQLLGGLEVTFWLCFITYLIGIVIGSLLGIARYRVGKYFEVPCRIVSVVISALPLLVLLFWLHYPLQYLLNVVIDPFYTGVAALSLVMIFMVSDTVARVLHEFPQEFIDAARVTGLSKKEMVWKIQLPIVVREVIPQILFIMVVILQGSLFTSLISVQEIFRVAQQINSDIYQPIPIYSALALFFIIICMGLNLLGIYFQSRFTWKYKDR